MFTQSHLDVPLLNGTLLGKCSGKTLQSPKEEFMQNCVKTLFMTSSFREVGCSKKEENTGFSALTLNLSQFRCCDNLKRAVTSKQPIHIETLNRLVRWIDQKPYKQQQQHKFGDDCIVKAGSTCSWFKGSLTFSTLYCEWLLGVFSVTMGLIYQSNVETSADSSAQISLRQGSRVIHQTFVCCQSHRTNDRTLINPAAEIDRNLHVTPL